MSTDGEIPMFEPNGRVRAVFPLAMWGLLLLALGLASFCIIAILALPARLIVHESAELRLAAWLAGAPVLVGLLAIGIDAIFLARRRRRDHEIANDPVANRAITVALTAYNDESSIAAAVADFTAHPLVKRVLVIDNNSTDSTGARAHGAGATVVTEPRQGYGHCVHRALAEAARYRDTELVALCEGDLTFRAVDLDKLLPYVPHADVVNGTRIVEQLRSPQTQLTAFMYWGNFVGAKLLEAKYLGRGTITDLGTTYKLCRSSFLREHLREFDPRVNLEFNAHFLDTVLRRGHKLVEAPITFHPRVGESKGGNVSNRRAARVGIRMLLGIAVSWRWVGRGPSPAGPDRDQLHDQTNDQPRLAAGYRVDSATVASDPAEQSPPLRGSRPGSGDDRKGANVVEDAKAEARTTAPNSMTDRARPR
jgi:hypothetical protein